MHLVVAAHAVWGLPVFDDVALLDLECSGFVLSLPKRSCSSLVLVFLSRSRNVDLQSVIVRVLVGLAWHTVELRDLIH